MEKIFLILSREYLTRVRKKSFIIMTILGPVLMASVFIVPVFISKLTDEKVTIAVSDELGMKLPSSEEIRFEYRQESFEELKNTYEDEGYYGVLYISTSLLNSPNGAILYSKKDVSISVKEDIREALEKELMRMKLEAHGIEKEVLEKMKSRINLRTYKASHAGEQQSHAEATAMTGFVGGILIYFFIFLYGAQVMRGVIEEKTSRIVEIIVSSVKPFQLMAGKIVGVAMVGLTQFLLWIILTAAITSGFSYFFFKNESERSAVQNVISGSVVKSAEFSAAEASGDIMPEKIKSAFQNIDFTTLIVLFIIYFLGGYLLYGALFAAIGSAVDSETDTQQFMLPITIPLIIAFFVAQAVVVTNPDSDLAFWFSIIPLTSPVVMMVRIPFGVPLSDLVISISLLILGFLFTTWIAARIYRTGILMYGKKVNYRELAKWLFYKG